MWIKADEPGVFWGQCAEYCGDSHAYMLFRARAVPEEEWERWRREQLRTTVKADGSYRPVALEDVEEPQKIETLQRGAELFTSHCARCHSVDARVQTMGPNLAHFGSRLTIAAGWLENEPANLARWIEEPNKIKPGNYMWYGFPDPNNPREVQMEGLKDAELSKSDIEDLVAYLYTLQ
jgi:cytochrome c oxidase subunit 2